MGSSGLWLATPDKTETGVDQIITDVNNPFTVVIDCGKDP